MATTNLTVRIDENLKAQFEELMDNLGLSMTSAITAFAKQAVREQQIPFRFSMNIPNEETRKVIEEAHNGINMSRGYGNVEELFADLYADD